MDYTFVEAILKECYVVLSERLNPSDILPYMDRWFTESEKQKVVCKLQQEGQRPANFELIGVIRRKLQPFITLVAATKVTQNDVLYKRMRDLIEMKKPDQLANLDAEINLLQRESTGAPEDRGSGSIDPPQNTPQNPYMLELPGASCLGTSRNQGSVSIDPPSIPPQNPDMVKPPEANWSGSSFTNQGSDRTSFPAIDPPNENIIVPMAAKRTEPSTSEPPPPATPDQNNYEDMELRQVKGKITRHIAKEIAKHSEDGTSHWTDVLDRLCIDLSMEEEEKIEESTNPGLKVLQLLGSKKLKVRELSEALLGCGLDWINNILFGRAGQEQPRLHPSSSEGYNINQLQGAGTSGNRQLNIQTSPDENLQRRSVISKSSDRSKFMLPATSMPSQGASQGSENTDDSSRNDSLESSDSNTNLTTSSSLPNLSRSPASLSKSNLSTDMDESQSLPSFHQGNVPSNMPSSNRSNAFKSSLPNLHRPPACMSRGNLPTVLNDPQLTSANYGNVSQNMLSGSGSDLGNQQLRLATTYEQDPYIADRSRPDALNDQQLGLAPNYRNSAPNMPDSGSPNILRDQQLLDASVGDNLPGNLPDNLLDDPELRSASPSYYMKSSNTEKREREPEESSIGSSTVSDSYPSLKDQIGRAPVQDPEGKKAALNPDTDRLKLVEDRVHQYEALGASLSSYGYENLHAEVNPPGDINLRDDENGNQQQCNLGSISQLPTPHLRTLNSVHALGSANSDTDADTRRDPQESTAGSDSQLLLPDLIHLNTVREDGLAQGHAREGNITDQAIETLSVELENINIESKSQDNLDSANS